VFVVVGPYIYTVTYYCDVARQNRKVCGVTFAEKFSEAVANLEYEYGDTIIDIHIDELEAGKVLELPAEIAEGIINGTV
jgi:hypothetical protein